MPIIVVSARSEDADKIGALDAGADDYLTKSFSVGELLARIRTTLPVSTISHPRKGKSLRHSRTATCESTTRQASHISATGNCT